MLEYQKMKFEPVSVVYIFGHGKSGSTLLDLILGAQTDHESVGEIINIDRYLNNNMACACGARVLDCTYWQEIIRQADNNLADNGVVQSHPKYPLTSGLKAFKESEKKHLLLKTLTNRLSESDIQEYNIITYFLFKAILAHSRKKIIVDSSKSFLRALSLSSSDLFNLKIIHLYRDHRDVLCSKKLKSQKNDENTKWRGMITECAEMWGSTVHKFLVLRYLRDKLNVEIFKISYKELYSNPVESLHRICAYIGTQFDPLTIEPSSLCYFSNSTRHIIGGNRVRFKSVPRLKYIQKWQDQLSRKEKAIFYLSGGQLFNYIQRIS